MSQEDVASGESFSPTTVSSWETQDNLPNGVKLERVAKKLDVSLLFLQHGIPWLQADQEVLQTLGLEVPEYLNPAKNYNNPVVADDSQALDAYKFFGDIEYREIVLMDYYRVVPLARPKNKTPEEMVPLLANILDLSPVFISSAMPYLDREFRLLANLDLIWPRELVEGKGSEFAVSVQVINDRIRHYQANPAYTLNRTEEANRDEAMLTKVVEESRSKYRSDNPIEREVETYIGEWIKRSKHDNTKLGYLLNMLKKHVPLEDADL